jgi:hypothetical protein
MLRSWLVQKEAAFSIAALRVHAAPTKGALHSVHLIKHRKNTDHFKSVLLGQRTVMYAEASGTLTCAIPTKSFLTLDDYAQAQKRTRKVAEMFYGTRSQMCALPSCSSYSSCTPDVGLTRTRENVKQGAASPCALVNWYFG